MIGDRVSVTSRSSPPRRLVCLAAGLQGYLRRECAWWERGLLVAALLLIKPGWMTDAHRLRPAGDRSRGTEGGARTGASAAS